MSIDVLTVSSKGQVVLPAEIRKQLSISSGDKLAAYASGDIIMLKVIKMPSEEDFIARMDEAKSWAESVGYQQDDINSIIKDVRKRNHA